MTVLLLKLAGPMQSWGASSRFVRRATESSPTKSGVIGLLAAAQGRRRTDKIEDLLQLSLGVRLDQPGRVVRDFQTAIPAVGKPLPLSDRFYLSDAAFLAVLEADRALLERLDDALRNPTFPLYLGRRSCPPVGPVTLGLRDGTIVDALEAEPWLAARWYRSKIRSSSPVRLRTVVDCEPAEADETIRDEPLSFDPQRREYGWRSVRHGTVGVLHPDAAAGGADHHDPMTGLEGDDVSDAV
ncbi:MAG: type I-E CRISPR-associated protein Cas5/CasD [Jatrophihabitantaceae bacterium]